MSCLLLKSIGKQLKSNSPFYKPCSFMKAMIDKIKELIKLLEQLNKLLLKVIELAGTVTLLVLAIKQIAEIF